MEIAKFLIIKDRPFKVLTLTRNPSKIPNLSGNRNVGCLMKKKAKSRVASPVSCSVHYNSRQQDHLNNASLFSKFLFQFCTFTTASQQNHFEMLIFSSHSFLSKSCYCYQYSIFILIYILIFFSHLFQIAKLFYYIYLN